ncbi:flagellin [Bacillus cereus]
MNLSACGEVYFFMSDFLKFKLLTEVALSMVSQANQIPQMVSKLLQS